MPRRTAGCLARPSDAPRRGHRRGSRTRDATIRCCCLGAPRRALPRPTKPRVTPPRDRRARRSRTSGATIALFPWKAARCDGLPCPAVGHRAGPRQGRAQRGRRPGLEPEWLPIAAFLGMPDQAMPCHAVRRPARPSTGRSPGLEPGRLPVSAVPCIANPSATAHYPAQPSAALSRCVLATFLATS
jgi:hypothetical protein